MCRITLNTYNRSDTQDFDESYREAVVIAGNAKGRFVELHQQGNPVTVNLDVMVMVHRGAPEEAPAAEEPAEEAEAEPS